MRICEIEGCKDKHYGKGLCKKHWNKQWLKDNPKYMKQYRKDNKEEITKQTKQYKENHKEYRAEYRKQWEEANPEYVKQWQEDNKEHLTKYGRQYRQTLAGKASVKAKNHNRRALTKDLTKEIVQRIYEDNIKKYGTLTCVLCWKPVEFADSSLEHLTPLSRGGSNDYENLGVAHRICNIKKGTKTLEEWNDRKPLTRKIKSDNISF